MYPKSMKHFSTYCSLYNIICYNNTMYNTSYCKVHSANTHYICIANTVRTVQCMHTLHTLYSQQCMYLHTTQANIHCTVHVYTTQCQYTLYSACTHYISTQCQYTLYSASTPYIVPIYTVQCIYTLHSANIHCTVNSVCTHYIVPIYTVQSTVHAHTTQCQ